MKYLTVIIFFAAIAVIFASRTKRRVQAPTKSDMHSWAMQTNILIDRYNNLNRVFAVNLSKMNNLAVLKEDAEALKEIGFTAERFDEAALKAKEALDLAVSSLSKEEAGLFPERLSEIEQCVEEMQTESDFLESIQVKDCRDELRNRSQEHADPKADDEFNFFCGCYTIEETEKRYKALVKAFHPDTGHGDEAYFQRLQNAYEEKRKSL